jgi:hypothetical protein
MFTFITKTLPTTDTKGTRVKVTFHREGQDPFSRIFPWDYARQADENHAAALELFFAEESERIGYPNFEKATYLGLAGVHIPAPTRTVAWTHYGALEAVRGPIA